MHFVHGIDKNYTLQQTILYSVCIYIYIYNIHNSLLELSKIQAPPSGPHVQEPSRNEAVEPGRPLLGWITVLLLLLFLLLLVLLLVIITTIITIILSTVIIIF